MRSHGLDFDREKFDNLVYGLIQRFKPSSILETGTCLGTGTTQHFAKTGLPVTTVEACKASYTQAINNLKAFPNVTCLHGYTLPLSDMEHFIQTDAFKPPAGIEADGGDKKVDFYLKEVRQGKLEENLLAKNLKPDQLVFLDSSGGVGWLEFETVLYSSVRPLLLVMDDVLHFKHYRSAAFLELHKLPYQRYEWWGYCFLEKPFSGKFSSDFLT